MTSLSSDKPGVIAPPPVIFLVAILFGVAIDYYLPTTVAPAVISIPVATGLIIAGMAVATWAFVEFHRSHTAVDPYKSTTAIVSSGPYGFSRNPMYLSLCLIHIAIGLYLGNLWVLAMLVPALAVIRFGVIAREERYLQQKFGNDYLRYKSRVGRWLGRRPRTRFLNA